MKTIKYNKKDINLDIKFDEEKKTIWMSQEEIAILYSKSRPRIANLIKEIKQNYPDFLSVCSENEQIQIAGKTNKTTPYNLDLIREIGYRINPSFTNEFCNWVNEQLNNISNQIIPIQSNIIRFEQDNIVLDVNVSPIENTAWITQDQLASLFGTDKQNINYHLSNIYQDEELEEWATVKEILTVQSEGNRRVQRLIKHYNLDIVMAIGYRINSKRGIMFRKWATNVLKQYTIKGYSFNDERIKLIENNYLYLKEDIDKAKERINALEENVNFKLTKASIFYNGQIYDAYDYLCNLVIGANESILVIDPYIDSVVLSILKNKKKNVRATLISTSKMSIDETALELYTKQYGIIEIIKANTFHDRFIVIDHKNLYVLGASINRIGHHVSTVIKLEEEHFIKYLEKTLSERKSM